MRKYQSDSNVIIPVENGNSKYIGSIFNLNNTYFQNNVKKLSFLLHNFIS